MRYFKDTTGQVHGYDETIPAFEPYIEKAIENKWKEVTGSYPPVETKDQAQTRLSPSITSAINDEAHQWGYDDIVSAVSYITSTNPQYVAEAKALLKWRDEVWSWAIPALNQVIPGETAGQFLANMPSPPARPVV
jgi:hypothetical protein